MTPTQTTQIRRRPGEAAKSVRRASQSTNRCGKGRESTALGAERQRARRLFGQSPRILRLCAKAVSVCAGRHQERCNQLSPRIAVVTSASAVVACGPRTEDLPRNAQCMSSFSRKRGKRRRPTESETWHPSSGYGQRVNPAREWWPFAGDASKRHIAKGATSWDAGLCID